MHNFELGISHYHFFRLSGGLMVVLLCLAIRGMETIVSLKI